MTDDPDTLDKNLDELDTKTLLAGIHAELTQMRRMMQAQNEPDSGQSEPLYACSMCGEHYPKSKMAKHGTQEHNAPPDTTAEDMGKRITE
jgi:hypothetical protein